MSNIKLIKSSIKKIDKDMSEKGNIYWFTYIDDSVKLISRSNDIKKSRKLVEKHIINNEKLPIKYIIKIEVITDLSILKSSIKQDKGTLTIYCDVFKIKNNKKIEKTVTKGRSKVIWYTNDEIIKNGFSTKDFKKIIYCVFYKKIKMSPFIDVTITDIMNEYNKISRYDLD